MAEDSVEHNNIKQTCILRASIHCEGCKRKVKKILSQLQGVEHVDIDTKQHKVTVIGAVDGDTLIRKLAKSGKKAELWPQTPQKIPLNGMKKEKEIAKHEKVKVEVPDAPPASDNGKTLESSTEVETASKISQGNGAPVKPDNGGGGGGRGDAKAVNGPSIKTSSGDVQEKKSEVENKSEESCSAAPEINEAVEKLNGGGGNGGDSGTSVKKKKKRGQIRNPATSAQVSGGGLENREPVPPQAANESPPRQHHFPPQPALHAQPAYAVSYNTAYPTSSYTASYYNTPPPYAHAYMHPGRQMEPPPLDPEMNARQPLDSFEMFSDENPNGCFIM